MLLLGIYSDHKMFPRASTRSNAIDYIYMWGMTPTVLMVISMTYESFPILGLYRVQKCEF